MRSKRILVMLAVLATTMLRPAVAFAQQSAPGQPSTQVPRSARGGLRNYLTIYLATNWGGDLFKDADRSSVTGLGVGWTYWTAGLFGGEVDFNYNNEFFGKKVDTGTRNRSLTLTANLIVGPTIRTRSQTVRPYIVAGSGLMRSEVKEFASIGWRSTENLGVIDIGGGVIYIPVPRVGVRGDLRYRRGVGADKSEQGWGLIDKWTYMRGTIGVVVAF
jgi:hypothetical protein